MIALQVREGAGIEYVMVMSAGVSFLNLLATLVLYRDPPEPPGTEQRHLGRVLRDMVMVFGNVRFLSFLVIFSGFWVMFWQIFYSLPFYVRDVLGFPDFELIETVDAWVLIVVTVPVTALMSRIRPIFAMSMGFAVASGSWLLIAAAPTVEGTIAAIALFSLGEAMQAPRFYEYVADLAPREQVGTYMGFAFLPVAFGALVAGPLSGYLIQDYIKAGHPNGMWVVLASIGFGTTVLMLVYDRLAARKR